VLYIYPASKVIFMASLQDQLLKAGLTTKQKTRQANSDQRKKNKQKRSGVDHGANLQEQVKDDLVKAKAEKQANDAMLNEQRQKALIEKENQLRILQILTHHQLKNISGESEYNYTFNNLIKKLSLDSTIHKALVNGRLAVCGVNDVSYVVTSETANKLAELDESIILVRNDNSSIVEAGEDDPYADFQIPDDLMW
jgi:uncharacterized protein YaiL (DUF2058 family)